MQSDVREDLLILVHVALHLGGGPERELRLTLTLDVREEERDGLTS